MLRYVKKSLINQYATIQGIAHAPIILCATAENAADIVHTANQAVPAQNATQKMLVMKKSKITAREMDNG